MDKDKMTLNNGNCQFDIRGCRRNSALQLSVTDWLCDLPENTNESDLVEVQFKKTRKGYYHNVDKLPLEKGSIVAVAAATGHDIGEVSLTGRLVELQMKKNHIDTSRYEIRNIYRFATEQDLQKRDEAKAKEQATMIKARQLAKDLGLKMKIGDVEYQGDGTKAIFYYIADERVDFRQLIKVFAETFRVRIEMKQIGARQEAGRIGGTGPCGRELCCATWMTNFHSVGTSAARLQNISPNPQKLAGQCAKLKCCLNYEVEVYQDAIQHFPDKNIPLETRDGTYYFFSSDPLKQEITYSSAPNIPANLQQLTPEQAKDIIAMNKRGEKPVSLGGKQGDVSGVIEQTPDYENVVGQDSLTRFDKKRSNNARGQGNRQSPKNGNRNNGNNRRDRQMRQNNKPNNAAADSNKNNDNQAKAQMPVRNRVNRPK